MINYKNYNNAYCSAVNAQNFETREQKYSINKYILFSQETYILIHI